MNNKEKAKITLKEIRRRWADAQQSVWELEQAAVSLLEHNNYYDDYTDKREKAELDEIISYCLRFCALGNYAYEITTY